MIVLADILTNSEVACVPVRSWKDQEVPCKGLDDGQPSH